MELPENIRNLLMSHVHEDRAIGISLLEKIKEYKKFFDSEEDLTPHARMIIFSETTSLPSTIVNTNKAIYWINTGRVYMWLKDKEKCNWGAPDKTIII